MLLIKLIVIGGSKTGARGDRGISIIIPENRSNVPYMLTWVK